MTHYASGPAALIYGAGYLKTPEFLRIGVIGTFVVLITGIWPCGSRRVGWLFSTAGK
ncbi:anion permease [Bifidobacterium tissieri]|uniref:anion permease n=1 Tax=Bifidobacterium tissieri TaxID=1630162 RepID=UPI0023BA3508|nr:anion permease [Bifidobacterium tissieri]